MPDSQSFLQIFTLFSGMREIATFFIVFSILVTVLGALIHFLGGSIELKFRESWTLALISLVFVAPGVMNIHIFANPNGSEDSTERVFALIRGVGMMITALVCVMPMFTNLVDRTFFIGGVGIGLLMNFGTLPLEAFFEHRKQREQ